MSAHDEIAPHRELRLYAIAALLVLSACGTDGNARESGSAATASSAMASAGSALATGPNVIRRARLHESFAELELSDAPFQFFASVERVSGKLDTVAVGVRSIEDTSVARIVDGAVVPLAVGQTSARLEISPGLVVRGIVSVTERVFADSVWLSRGQVRAWELKPGWYRITVDAKAPPRQPQPLELAADLICVPDSRGPRETIVCRVRQNTRVLLRHTGAGMSPGPALAVVTILITPR